jgi:hypothetical protein
MTGGGLPLISARSRAHVMEIGSDHDELAFRQDDNVMRFLFPADWLEDQI